MLYKESFLQKRSKTMEFIVGCNYWASNAGTNMWKDFDIDVIENDIRILR